MTAKDRLSDGTVRQVVTRLVEAGVAPAQVAAAARVREPVVWDLLGAPSSVPPRLRTMVERTIIGGGDHSVFRRLDAMRAEGFTDDEFFDAAQGLVVPCHVGQKASTEITRLGALLATRALMLRKAPRDELAARAAREAGAVAAYRWGGRIDGAEVEPRPEKCLREDGRTHCWCSVQCRAAAARTAKWWKMQGSQRVPAQPSRDHLRALLSRTGAPVGHVKDVTGISPRTLNFLLDGTSAQVCRDTHEAITSITVSQLRDAGVWVPAFRVFRRLDALMVQGWSTYDVMEHVAGRTGITTKDLLRRRYKEWFTRPVFDAVDEFFREHVRSAGPSAITASRARREGRIPWLLWEDIDDASERPDVKGVRRDDEDDVDEPPGVLAGVA